MRLALLIFFFPFCAAAQETEKEISILYQTPGMCPPDTAVRIFMTAEEAQAYTHSSPCKAPDISGIDFSSHTLVAFNYSGVDCHSTFDFKLTKYPEQKKWIYTVYVYDGGCRAAGGFYTQWAVIPKIPEGFTFTLKNAIIGIESPLWKNKGDKFLQDTIRKE